jgi:pyrroline-5-carboxylate reductase
MPIGCGKISSALCKGYAGASFPYCPKKILVSRRNEEKSAALAAQYPSLVAIEDDNAQLVEQSDIIFVGLLPGVAREILPTLQFTSKVVISMMAAVPYEETLSIMRIGRDRLVRTVPLPSSARRCGPILCYPPNPALEEVLRVVGTPIVFDSEDEMKTAICVTGQISPFFELMRVTEDWIIRNGKKHHLAGAASLFSMICIGVNPDRAHPFIASFYSSLAQGAELSEESFAGRLFLHSFLIVIDQLCTELCHEAATPGGLNEQSISGLRAGTHYTEVEQSLSALLKRLKG